MDMREVQPQLQMLDGIYVIEINTFQLNLRSRPYTFQLIYFSVQDSFISQSKQIRMSLFIVVITVSVHELIITMYHESIFKIISCVGKFVVVFSKLDALYFFPLNFFFVKT